MDDDDLDFEDLELNFDLYFDYGGRNIIEEAALVSPIELFMLLFQSRAVTTVLRVTREFLDDYFILPIQEFPGSFYRCMIDLLLTEIPDIRAGTFTVIEYLINSYRVGTLGEPMDTTEINQLTHTTPTQVDIDNVLSCAVCLCDIGLTENIIQLPCAHKFHTACISPWLEIRGVCPVCRREARLEEFLMTR